ncbi:MAG: 2-C-methyl-D-erythritol 4-phosphate cytidylyltransferase [Candidatus Korobacteraceae bacterium]
MSVIVILPAAGLGTRMAPASGRPGMSKQFAELGGVPVVIHTLRKFAAHPEVSEIYVAVRASEIRALKDRVAKENLTKPIHVVEGGEHRQDSVARAMEAVHARESDLVLVHDAVRPFVDAEIIQKVIDAAQRHGAAIAAVPAVDTIKQVERTAEGAIVRATIPREQIVLVQTPQGFRYSVLKQAMQEAQRDGFTGTDEAALVERSGGTVAVVMGTAKNFKITTPGDVQLAEFYLQQEMKS